MKTHLIQSTNTTFGFYGTMRGNYGLMGQDINHVFDICATALMQTFKLTEEQAVQYLDSKCGRHLADSLSFYDVEDGSSVDQIKAAITRYFASYKNQQSTKNEFKMVFEEASK